MRVQYSYDNVTYTTGIDFTGTAAGGSNWRRVGTTTDMTSTLQDFSFTIAGAAGGTTLYVRVQADYFGASKEVAFDNIRVQGTVATVAPPTLANIESTSVNYAEGAAPTQITNALTVSSPGSTLSSATVQLQASVGILSASDVLSFSPGNSISGSYNSATGLLTLSGTSSTANYQAALRSVTYVNTDVINATPGTRTAVFAVADGSNASATTSRNIVVTASLNGPTPLNYTESFETNGEGTRYGSNSFNQNSQAFIRTSQNPVSGVSSTTYSNIEQSNYWYAEGTKDNATGAVGVLQLAPVNATNFRDLHFIWRVGRGGNGWQANDYVRLYYDAGSGPQLFGAFYGTGGSTPQVRRDADLDGIADTNGTLLTSSLQDIDFTLPAALANQPDIDFRIEVANNGGEELAFDYIRITGVSNQPPVINAQTFSVAENSANGTVVGTVVASDPDAGQTLTYAITVNPSGAFAINSSTGQIRVANSAALNFEATPSFALTVQVTDNASSPLSASNTVTINLTNVNEAPVIAAQTFSVAENSANGTVVGTVVASDPDAGTTLAYSITAGNTSGAFAINAATGQLTVANTAALDFETTPTFALTVQVTDNGSPVLSASNTITVNLTDVPNATYVSSTAEQNTRGVLAGSTNQVILRIPVVLGTGVDQPLSATSFTFSTTGTTTPADVAAARIYYTGTSGSFAPTNLFTSVPTPGTGAIVVSGSQVLQPNTNYFWLVYDVAATAATGNLLDARLSALTVGGVSRTPTVTAPAGARTVIDPSEVAGTALRFSGTAAGYVDLGASNPNLVLGQQYTLEAWVKPTASSGTVLNGILGNSSGTAGQVAPYIAIAANNQVETGYGNGSSTITASTATNATTSGQWNQIVATFNGNVLSLYVNGTLLSQTIGGGTSANTAVRYLGTLTPSASTFFNGDVDEVAMWTRVLTQNEIRLRRHLVLSGSEADLTSYLQFNEANGNVQDIISGASGPLTGSGVSRVTSTAPVATGVSNLQTVSGSSNVTFTGTGVAINFTGSGNYTVSIARLSGKPQGTQPSGLVRYYNEAYWVINKYESGTFSNAAVTYTLRPTTLSAIDAANPNATLRLLKRDSKSDGAFDSPIAATAANQAAGTVTFNVTSFSQTVVGTLGTSPLPVELTRFTAERQGEAGLLRWATASEKNSAYFAVESSLTGRDFRELGQVPAQGTSNQTHEYQFVDAQLTRYGAKEVYYRLRQVDQDGTVAYSPVRTLSLPTVTGPAQLLAYPNPAHDRVQVLLTGTTAAPLELFDAVGRLVRSQPIPASEMETTLPLTGLPAGVYVLRCGPLSQRLNVE